MVSDGELAEKVHEFLRGSDLMKTTNNIVIRKLESDFGVDLSHKKPFLRNQVDLFLQSQYNYSDEDEDPAPFGRDVYSNDSDSDNDFYEDDDAQSSLALQADNGSTTFNHIAKFQRSRRQNKVKNKRVCDSGKLCTLSPELQKFVGAPRMPQSEVIKRLWSYVRDKNLQDPHDGKNIVCDETLRDLLGVNFINKFQINKALTKHILPVKPLKRDKPRKQEGQEGKPMKRIKARKHEREEDPLEAEKPAKKVYSGFLAPLPLSDTLIRFLGTGESALTRADVIKRVWEYIKDKNLQDPYEKKTVICDEKLRELFNVDSFHGFTVSKLLSAHFVKL